MWGCNGCPWCEAAQRYGSGFALDFVGGRLGMPRFVGEPDETYLAWLNAVTEEVSPDFVGPNDPTHRAVNDAIKGLRNKLVVPAARRELGKALDGANKADTGRLPDGTHRAPESKAFG